MKNILITSILGIGLISLFFFWKTNSAFDPLKNTTTVSPVGTVDTPEGSLAPKNYERIGFLPFWMLDNAEFLHYEDLTEIVYFGLHIDAEGNFITTTEEDGTSEMGWLNWNESTKLRRVFENAERFKVRKSVAIVMQDNEHISTFLDCRTCWSQLSRNMIQEMREKNVHNLNVDFEYIGIAPEHLRNEFPVFVDFITKQIHTEFSGSVVVVDTHADAAYRARLHDIKKLSAVSDLLFVMAYDFHQLEDDQTGPLAPIGGAPVKYRYDLNTMLEDYLQFTVKEKIVMGVAYYGHLWITEDGSLGSIRIPGDDTIGYSKIVYYKLCNDSPKNEMAQWEEEAQAPWFAYYDEGVGVFRQCHYESVRSLRAKYDLVKTQGLKGIGIWALGYDGDKTELWDLLEEEF